MSGSVLSDGGSSSFHRGCSGRLLSASPRLESSPSTRAARLGEGAVQRRDRLHEAPAGDGDVVPRDGQQRAVPRDAPVLVRLFLRRGKDHVALDDRRSVSGQLVF